jgi:hypothetical protein
MLRFGPLEIDIHRQIGASCRLRERLVGLDNHDMAKSISRRTNVLRNKMAILAARCAGLYEEHSRLMKEYEALKRELLDIEDQSPHLSSLPSGTGYIN